ncbi:MAG: ATP-binding protein [Actinobacteria bacterium]|nr:ATP-binding protein [Actinomycetota bacterium]
MSAERNISPYRPGAGVAPPRIAGRERCIERFDESLDELFRGGYAPPRVLIGIRGLGKTVLLREYHTRAIEKGWHVVEIEARRRRPVDELLLNALNQAIRDLEPSKAVLRDVAAAVRSALTIKVRAGEPFELEWTLSAEDRRGEAGRGAGVELVDVLRAVTYAARTKSRGLLLLIDELHEAPEAQLESTVMALHRLEGTHDLPLMTVVAGLPPLPGRLVHNRSYAERLFRVDELVSLTTEQVIEALQVPARKLGRDFADDALQSIDAETLGYPFLVQEWGDQLWRRAGGETITQRDVDVARNAVIDALDTSFYRLRSSGLSPREREFVNAMARLPREAMIGQVAGELGKQTTAVSPVRQQLLDKGVVIADGRGRLAFAVPGYRDHLQRLSQRGFQAGMRL